MTAVAMRYGGGLVLALVSVGAVQAAPDGDAVAAALTNAITAQGDAQVTHASVAVVDDVVMVSGLEATVSFRPGSTVSLPSLEIAGIETRDAGGFIAQYVTFDGGRLSDQGRVLFWEAARAERTILPSPDEVKAATKLRPFALLRMEGVRLESPSGEPLATVDRLIIEIGEIVEKEPSRLRIEGVGMWVSTDMIGGTRRRALLKALGYDGFSFDLTLESKINLDADTLVLDPLIVKIADVGDVRIDGEFSGVSIGGFAIGSRRASAREAAMIDRFTLRFDNAGLVERALDRQASLTGVPRAEFVERFVGAIPFMLNFIGNQPFQNKLAVVAVDFLRQPRSLTIASSPPSPVSLDQIAKTAVADRSVLPDLLAIEITAND